MKELKAAAFKKCDPLVKGADADALVRPYETAEHRIDDAAFGLNRVC